MQQDDRTLADGEVDLGSSGARLEHGALAIFEERDQSMSSTLGSCTARKGSVSEMKGTVLARKPAFHCSLT